VSPHPKSWAATPSIQWRLQAAARLELHNRRDEIALAAKGPALLLRQRIIRNLLPYQAALCEDTEHRIIGFVAGYGAGKTRALCAWATLCALDNPNTIGALFAPTGPLVRDVVQRALEDFLQQHGITYTFRASPLPEYELTLPEGNTVILCRSMENWERIIGVNLSFIGSDEIDTSKTETAKRAIEKFLGRLRAGNRRQLGLFSTPEGYGALYALFVEQGEKTDRKLYRARTADNPYLPDDFLPALLENYSPALAKAYTEGEFVNLTTGNVYDRFDRAKNLVTELPDVSGEPLRIGIDFNVGNMSAVIAVHMGNHLLVIDEISGAHDTDALAQLIHQRYPDRRIYIYPDASGGARSTNATRTDIQILESYGMSNQSPRTNPFVRDRVAAVQALLENGKGEVRLFIHESCKKVIQCLELQCYTSGGEPDKDAGHDHMNDALGYVIWRLFNPLEARAGKGTGIRIY
jgi:hypothetical protein